MMTNVERLRRFAAVSRSNAEQLMGEVEFLETTLAKGSPELQDLLYRCLVAAGAIDASGLVS